MQGFKMFSFIKWSACSTFRILIVAMKIKYASLNKCPVLTKENAIYRNAFQIFVEVMKHYCYEKTLSSRNVVRTLLNVQPNIIVANLMNKGDFVVSEWVIQKCTMNSHLIWIIKNHEISCVFSVQNYLHSNQLWPS